MKVKLTPARGQDVGLMTLQEAAELIGQSKHTLYGMVANDRLKTQLIGHSRMVTINDLLGLIADRIMGRYPGVQIEIVDPLN